MIKKIYVKTRNKLLFLEGLRMDLEREGIEVADSNPYTCEIRTKHVSIRAVSSAGVLDGVRLDEFFYFDLEDHMEHRLKDPSTPRYKGTPLGYIIKTEAEETLRENEEWKTHAKRAINAVFGLPKYSDEMWKDINDAFEESMKEPILWPKVNPYLPNAVKLPEIKKVIFNAPATIVLWADGTKTVVKATDEEYDPEKGLAMAISKKALGNKREYYHTFLHWLKKYDDWKVLEDKATREFCNFITTATGFGVAKSDEFHS